MCFGGISFWGSRQIKSEWVALVRPNGSRDGSVFHSLEKAEISTVKPILTFLMDAEAWQSGGSIPPRLSETFGIMYSSTLAVEHVGSVAKPR